MTGTDAAFRPGTVIAGKYVVERVLGRGGMGVVLAARHIELEERFAIKFLLPEGAAQGDMVARFMREGRAAVKIRSEHVARIFDVGKLEHGLPYLVMEYLDGEDLATLVDRGPLAVEDAVDYVLQACEAIAEAHALGIVHRDLKPANLFLVQRADGSPCVKVLDFGISKLSSGATSGAMTRTSALMGSPLYMSPEQMTSARDVDARSDVWSLGVILYELVTGQPPFLGDTLPQVCASILQGEPAPASTVSSRVPARLDAVIARCLAKQPGDRFGNVAQLGDALAPFGSAQGQYSALRIARVLRTASRAGPALPPAPAVTEPAASQRTLPLSESAPQPSWSARPAQTIESWGKTGPGAAPAAQRGPHRLALAAAGVVLLGGVGAFFAMNSGGPRRSDEQVAASSPAAPLHSAPAQPQLGSSLRPESGSASVPKAAPSPSAASAAGELPSAAPSVVPRLQQVPAGADAGAKPAVRAPRTRRTTARPATNAPSPADLFEDRK